jgi:peptide/nickel transport system substrate-binding protein
MKKLFRVSLMILLASILFVGGCSQSASSPTPPPIQSQAPASAAPPVSSAASEPQKGGILKIISNTGVVNIGDPGQPFGPPMNLIVGRVCTESLINLAGPGNFTPCLASTWQYSQDYKSLTFNLRQGVKFHDGTDFNATAVKFNLETGKKIQADLKSISSIDVVDNYTVRLNLSAFEPRLIMGLAGVSGRMFSPTALGTMGTEALTHPVGTGPFKFTSYLRDASLKFERFNDYWDKGKPYLDGIEFVFIADGVTRLMSFQSGAGQALLDPTPKDAVDLATSKKYIVNKCPSMITGLVGDSSHPNSPFANIKVRQAISYAINNTDIVKAQGYGFWEAINQLAVSSAKEYNPSVTGYTFNPQKAKDLLSQAGYAQGFPTKLSCQTSDTTPYIPIQAYLKDVGMDVTMDLADAARFTQMQVKGWDNQLMFYSLGYSYGIDFGYALSSGLSNSATKYPSTSVLIPPDYQTLLDKANAEPDSQKRIAMLQDANKMIVDQYCLITPVFVSYALAAVKTPEVHNLDLATIANHVWHPGNAWIGK